MVINCDIKFDHNPYGIYFSGQVISGRIEITLDKPKKVRGIFLKIIGYAQTEWKEQQSGGSNKRKKTIKYNGREDYLCTTTYLVGSEYGVYIHISGFAKTSWSENETYYHNGKSENKTIFFCSREDYLDTRTYLCGGTDANQLELLPGIHTYNFSCALPPMLPTSFEGTHGHIRYTVRVALERPWKFDQSYKVAFTVLKQLDLNYDSPILRIPSQMEVKRNFWCGPCSTGPLTVIAHIPQSGYVSGQAIIVQVEIANASSIPLNEIKFVLRKIISYHSQTPTTKTKIEIIDVVERRTGGVAKHDTGRFQQSLTIPSLPPTNISLCRVLHTQYEVMVEIKAPGVHENPRIFIPITIGTVPLSNNFPDPKTPTISTGPAVITTQPLPSMQNGYLVFPSVRENNNEVMIPPNAPPLPGPSRDGSLPIVNSIYDTNDNSRQSYLDLPPPSYEESILGNYHIEDEDDKHPIARKPYTPRYPVYHFNGGEINNTGTASAPSLTPGPHPDAPQNFQFAMTSYNNNSNRY